LEWVEEVEERGAGEILLQSVDHDGRGRGFDIELAKKVVESVDIPVVVASGAGSLDDIGDLARKVDPSGIAIASVLHYGRFSIAEIKKYLVDIGVEVSNGK
jgi:cyclase